jgi:nucleoside-diphosphate-sugar epimerase
MNVALTGSTGFIGSHVLADLQEHGHDVTALVRSERQAESVAAGGATAVVVDLFDRHAVAAAFRGVDGAIHTASPGDQTSADLDAAVVDGAIEAFTGTSKPYAHVSGLWIYGSNPSVTEDSPFDAPPLVAWKLPIQDRLLYGSDIRGAVVVAGTAYGDGGGGIPGLLLGSPRDDAGNLIMLGSGRQHWGTVHVADLAEVFRLVLERDSAHGYYIVEDESRPTVAELTEAAAVAAGAPGAVPGSDREARARLGDAFAEVLLLDQSASANKARTELGWRPSHPGLVEDFRSGSYRARQAQEQR